MADQKKSKQKDKKKDKKKNNQKNKQKAQSRKDPSGKKQEKETDLTEEKQGGNTESAPVGKKDTDPNPTPKDFGDELMVGIDVGTQNTTAVFHRDGKKFATRYSSVVGFPKNNLSRQKLEDILGRPVAYDNEVYDNMIMQNVDLRWPLKTFDDNYEEGDTTTGELTDADRTTLNLVVKRVLSSKEIRQGIKEGKYLRLSIATPSTSTLQYNQELIDFARRNLPEDSRPAFLVESEAHLGGYLLSRMDRDLGRKGVVVVDIGAGTRDFHVYDGNPSDATNTLSQAGGGNSVTTRLYKLLRDKGYQNTWQEVDEIKIKYGQLEPSATAPQDDPELVIDDLRYQGRDDVRADIGPEIEQAHRPLLDGILDGFKKLVNQYDKGPVPETVVLVGLQGQTPGLKKAFQEALAEEQYSVTVKNLDDFPVDDKTTFTARGALERIENTPFKELFH